MSGVVPAFVPPSQPLTEFVLRLTERFRYWRERRRWITELRRASTACRLDELLADIGLDRARLDVLVNAPLDAGRQLDAMAAATGARLDQVPVQMLRDAEWTCTVCESRAACGHWLRTGEWARGDTRCPNAELLHSS